MSRITDKFTVLKSNGKTAFVPFIMGGDPDLKETLSILKELPKAGADIIEIGIPFSDPMADGPTIQLAGLRALKHNISIKDIFKIIKTFRTENNDTPIILMGYYNPIYQYGLSDFCREAFENGVDGMIIVDLPPEEEDEFIPYTQEYGLSLIKLITPTTDEARLQKTLKNASGFLYYVAVAGITGDKSAAYGDVGAAISQIKKHTDLPVAVGFGIKTQDDVKNMSQHADAVVVGSALVKEIAASKTPAKTAEEFVSKLASALS